MSKGNEWWKGAFGALGLVLILLAGGWMMYRASSRNQPVNEQGTTTTTPETAAPIDADEIDAYEYPSPKGVVLKLDRKLDDTLLTSPVTITGSVPGNWSFEASFPVEIRDTSGRVLSQEPATLQGDWMTTDYVPFTVTLTFDEPEDIQDGTLILRRDNPSGLPENEDQVEIDIKLGATK